MVLQVHAIDREHRDSLNAAMRDERAAKREDRARVLSDRMHRREVERSLRA